MKTNPLVAFLCLCAISIPFGLMAAPHADHKKGFDDDGNPLLILTSGHFIFSTTNQANYEACCGSC